MLFIFLLSGCRQEIVSDKVNEITPLSPTQEPVSNSGIYQEDNWRYLIEHNGIMIKSYEGNPEELVIPDMIDGKNVVTIRDTAFYQKTDMKRVVLPSKLQFIGDNAFYKCYTLEFIDIPASVEEIGSNPFFRCSSLKKIFVSENNLFFSDQDGVLYNKEGTKLLVYPEGREEEIFVIPDTVTAIDSDAFGYCPKCKIFQIPSGVIDFPREGLTAYDDEIELLVMPGSIAEAYAIEKKIAYRLLDV